MNVCLCCGCTNQDGIRVCRCSCCCAGTPTSPLHLAGHVVSRSTYERYGCRCEGCSAAKSANNKIKYYRGRVVAPPVREAVLLALARGKLVSGVMAEHHVSYTYVKRLLDSLLPPEPKAERRTK